MTSDTPLVVAYSASVSGPTKRSCQALSADADTRTPSAISRNLRSSLGVNVAMGKDYARSARASPLMASELA